jgi:hypothetical protein
MYQNYLKIAWRNLFKETKDFLSSTCWALLLALLQHTYFPVGF